MAGMEVAQVRVEREAAREQLRAAGGAGARGPRAVRFVQRAVVRDRIVRTALLMR